jgi:glucose/arabinose dehydrogenase
MSGSSWRAVASALVVAAVVAACGGDVQVDSRGEPVTSGPSARDLSARFELSVWGDGEFEATDLAFLPDGRALVVTKGGWSGPGEARVVLVDAQGAYVADLLSLPVCTDFERGLLGVAVDPSLDERPFVYLFYTPQMSECAVTDPLPEGPVDEPVWNRLSAFRLDPDGIDPASEQVLLDGLPGHQSSHNGGGLAFLPDGTLLVATGEGDYQRSDELDFPAGKLLRVDPRTPGVPPEDNPHNTGAGTVRDYVYASGFRNPFRIAAGADGTVVAADVGSDRYEEINVVAPGGFHGYPFAEGPEPAPDAVAPAYWYSHDEGCVSVIGGDFAAPQLVPGGTAPWYTFTDLVCGQIWAVAFDDGAPVDVVRIAKGLEVSPAALRSGPDGAIYVVSIGPGPQPLLRLAPTARS